MPYANKTDKLQLPYWWQNELSSGLSNRRAALILDRQLGLLTKLVAGQNILFGIGTVEASFVSGNSSVTLTALNGSILDAIINGVFVSATSGLTWAGIPNSATAYLYAVLAETSIYNISQFSSLESGQVQTLWNSTGHTPANGFLIGKATTSGSNIFLTANPTDLDTFLSGWVTAQSLGTIGQRLAYFEKGDVNIPLGQTSVQVGFVNGKPNTNYSVAGSIENLFDSDVGVIGWIVTAKTTSGFTVQFDNEPDTNHYFFRWSVS